MIRSQSFPSLEAAREAISYADSQTLVSHLLIACSTYVPTGAHALEIRRQLTQTLPAQLETIDSQIYQLQSILGDLCRQRAALLNVVGVHSASVSVVRRLPTEILYDIFVKTIWNADVERDEPFASEQLKLMRVCKRWDEVIRGSPQLWTNIDMAGHDPFGATRVYNPGNLNRLLGLSQNLPLSLNIRAPNTIPPSIWVALASHSSRWRSAKLTINHEHLKLISDMRVEFSELEELSLVCVGEGYGPGLNGVDDPPLCAFERAPRLRIASITDHVANSYSSRITLPWTQLDQLECIGHYVPRPNTSTAFPHLYHLSYFPANHIVSPSDALDGLTLPSLRSLSLGQYHHASAISLIERSFCRVQTLVLSHAWVRDHLLDLLDVCPSLVELRVTVDDYTPFDTLWPYLSSRDVLPNMESLVVSLSTYTRQIPGNFQGSSFLSMLKQRNGLEEAESSKFEVVIAPLKLVRLTNVPRYSTSFTGLKMGLDMLRGAGVDVNYVFRD